ncbi:hypothetical protein LJC63_10105 [Ruminococcaceae bacterium OttesenSCG-928-L11]|nr:hypothetical protein [Ruminococcaceae bacterium OttesenSCG-928-L11]
MPGYLGRLLEQAYRVIGDATPLPVDCGQLCETACCQGGDEVGMLLFPGEQLLLAGKRGFEVSRIDYMGGRAWFVGCAGTCDRELRPLACRVFPLGPQVLPSGRVRAVPDPRSRRMCPLATGEFLDPAFVKAVGAAFSLLAREPAMLRFMKRISDEMDELNRFF